MTQYQSDIRTLKTLLIAANGGNPGEDVDELLNRATLSFQRVRDGVRESERRRKAIRAAHTVTPEERFMKTFNPDRVHLGRGFVEETL